MTVQEEREIELCVIGEVNGRWETASAFEWEREAAPAVLHELTDADFHWRFVDDADGIFPVNIEWLRNESEYEPLARVRRRRELDNLWRPSFVKCTVRYPIDTAEVRELSQSLEAGVPLSSVLSGDAAEMIAFCTSNAVATSLSELELGVNIARPGALHFGEIFQFVDEVLGPQIYGDLQSCRRDCFGI